ncbi:MAG: thiamine pyrophosphate-binding protein [Deltaproteobacteria bacterium]|nr:thiamine pyrophosphate-binding protein [Deltaproteobacteria bacterium]
MTTSPVALQLIDVLREFGVDTVFGIPGGAISGFYASLLARPDVKIVTTRHETGAAFMAIGYAMATGRPGVVVTTAGPGITNALTGLASAYYEGVPLILLAGEVPRSAFGRGALQEGSAAAMDAVALTRRMTKFSAQVSRPGSAAAVLRKALVTAYSGRQGPVFLSLPLDVVAVKQQPQPIFGTVRSSFDVDSSACKRALELLEGARRPLLLAGAGARGTTSRRVIRRLAEYVGAPVAVTTKGKGVFPEDHPLYLGVLGFGGHDSVTDYLAEGVDVLLAMGTGLNDFTTNAWSPKLRAGRAFIQVDIDSAQLGKNYPIELGLVGPIDAVVGRMLEHRTEDHAALPLPPGPTLRCQAPEASPRGALTSAEVALTMNAVCPADSVFTSDMGEHLSIALHYLRVREDGDFITCLGFGSMGSGLCAAVGYQLGAPARRVYAICGDGGFLMFGGELATAVHHKVATTFVIINDSRLNMVHHGMKDEYGATPDFTTPLIDFSMMAQGFGAAGRIVRTKEELIDALGADHEGPAVLDVRIDPDVRLGGSQRVAALRQFKEQGDG